MDQTLIKERPRKDHRNIASIITKLPLKKDVIIIIIIIILTILLTIALADGFSQESECDLNNAVVWMISARPLVSNSSSSLTKPLGSFPAPQLQLIAFSSSCSIDLLLLFVCLFVCYASLGVSAFYYLLTSTFTKRESLHLTYTLSIQYLDADQILLLVSF